MAKACKNVMVDGRMVEKEVEEYAAFEFDRFGDMTLPASLEDDEKYGAYDGRGNRTDCSDVSGWFVGENHSAHFEGKKGQLVHELGILEEWIWKDKNDRVILRIGKPDFMESQFDSDGNLIRLYSDGEDFAVFEYEGVNLVHARKWIRDAPLAYAEGCPIIEDIYFEYSDGMLVHEKRKEKIGEDIFDGLEVFYEYDGGRLVREITKDYDGPVEYKTLSEYDKKGHECYSKIEAVEDGVKEFSEIWTEYDERDWLIQEKKSVYSKDKGYDYLYLVKSTYEMDDKGNLVCSKDCVSGPGQDDKTYDTWYEYDSKGRLSRKKGSDYEIVYRYDSAGHLTYEEEVGNSGKIYEYDLEGHLVCEKEIQKGAGYKERRWDSKGRLISARTEGSKGDFWHEKTWGWDEEGKLRFEKSTSSKKSLNKETQWDSLGRVVYFGNSILEKWIEYGMDNDLVYRHGHNKMYVGGYELVSTPGGQLVSLKHDDDFLEFDQAGNLIRYNDGKTDEWYEYDFYDDGSLKRKVCLREA